MTIHKTTLGTSNVSRALETAETVRGDLTPKEVVAILLDPTAFRFIEQATGKRRVDDDFARRDLAATAECEALHPRLRSVAKTLLENTQLFKELDNIRAPFFWRDDGGINKKDVRALAERLGVTAQAPLPESPIRDNLTPKEVAAALAAGNTFAFVRTVKDVVADWYVTRDDLTRAAACPWLCAAARSAAQTLLSDAETFRLFDTAKSGQADARISLEDILLVLKRLR